MISAAQMQHVGRELELLREVEGAARAILWPPLELEHTYDPVTANERLRHAVGQLEAHRASTPEVR